MSLDNLSDHICKRCALYIPTDHQFCEKHYEEAKAHFQEKYQHHLEKKARWDALEPQEQALAHDEANLKELRNYTLKFSLLMTFILHYIYTPRAIITVSLAFTLVGGALYSSRLASSLGRFVRGITRGIKYAILIPLIMGTISIIFDLVLYRDVSLIFGLLLGLIVGLWRESLGIYQRSAEPIAPLPPRH
jgi:hypothetical protein